MQQVVMPDPDGRRRWPRRNLLVAVLVELVVAGGLIAYSGSPGHQLHDPVHALQQIDMFYLDEPAPLADRLRLPQGVPTLVVICRACRAPRLTPPVHLTVTSDPTVAAAYGLRTATGRIGSGYAVIDRRGRQRYRTFDPGIADHGTEITILLEAAR